MSQINWWEKWEYSDWLTDEAVGKCSMLGRGVWAEFLNLMMKGKTYKVEGTISDLSRLARCSPMEIDMGLRDIERTKVGDVTRCNGIVTVTSRRRLREHNEREVIRLRVTKHRGNIIAVGDVTPKNQTRNANVPSNYNSYSSGSSPGGGVGEVSEKTPMDTVYDSTIAIEAQKWATELIAAYSETVAQCGASVWNTTHANCCELVALGKPREKFELLCDWIENSKNTFKPKSPQAASDPVNWSKWQTSIADELERAKTAKERRL